MTFRYVQRCVRIKRLFFGKRSPPDTCPGFMRKDIVFIGNLAPVPDFPGHGRADQSAVFVDVTQNPIGALHFFQDDLKDFLKRLVIRNGQKNLRYPVFELQTLLGFAEGRFDFFSQGDLFFQFERLLFELFHKAFTVELQHLLLGNDRQCFRFYPFFLYLIIYLMDESDKRVRFRWLDNKPVRPRLQGKRLVSFIGVGGRIKDKRCSLKLGVGPHLAA